MKQRISLFRSPKSSGFTLVELLVVIGIIAILASVILNAGSYAIKSAQRAKAAAMASQIQTSVMNYYTEYSLYPQDTTAFTAGKDYTIADTTPSTDGVKWRNLLLALCGNTNPYTGLALTGTITTNTRSISFLSIKSTDILYASTAQFGPKNPLPTSSTANIYFNIAIDGDYDNVLGVGNSNVTTLPNFATGTVSTLTLTGGSATTGCAVWANCNGSTATDALNWVHTY